MMMNERMYTGSERPKITSISDTKSNTCTAGSKAALKCQKALLPAAVNTAKLQKPKIVTSTPNHVSENPMPVNSSANCERITPRHAHELNKATRAIQRNLIKAALSLQPATGRVTASSNRIA